MQMTVRLRHHLLPVVLVMTALASCDRDEAPAMKTAPTPLPARPAPAPMPVAAVPAAEDHGPEGGAVTDTTIVASGDWTENKQYKFRLERVAACGAPSATLGPAQPTAAPISAFRGETTWVGALFTVEAKDKAVFVSPRDMELRRGGVILNARHINQPLLPGCKPLLAPKPLKVGENISGFALFEVPRSFRTTTDDPIVLSYKPTRWGGARRVDVPIRECLDACPESPPRRSSKTSGRSAPAPRPRP